MVVGDMATSVDVVVLGGGPGGYVAAIRAAQLRKEVVIVSDGPLGGTCLNEGCIPSKTLLTAADRVWQMQHSADMGIQIAGVMVDFEQMQRWKQGVVENLTAGVATLLQKNKITVVHGKGWFINDGEVRVEGSHGSLRYMYEQAIIAVGAESTALPGLPFEGTRVINPMQALALAQLPSAITIIGADYIAAELATIFSKLGVSTRLLLAPNQRLLPNFEIVAGRMVQAQLKKLGVKVESNIEDMVAATEADSLIVVSVGFTPRTMGLHLADAGVRTNAQGLIPVNGRMQTNISHIYAVGDVVNSWPLATFAIKQGKIAAEALAGQAVEYAPQALPRVAWTDPEVAMVGLTATQAQEMGYEVMTGRFPLGANGRAMTLDRAGGTVITVAEAESGILLGVTVVSPRASEVINEAALAIEMGATLTDLAETLHPHPGLGEALQESAEVALKRAVHVI